MVAMSTTEYVCESYSSRHILVLTGRRNPPTTKLPLSTYNSVRRQHSGQRSPLRNHTRPFFGSYASPSFSSPTEPVTFSP